MKIAALAVLAAALAAPAVAQEASEDWDFTADSGQQLTLASLDFGANALALRCKAGVLEVLLTGVPATTTDSRSVQVTTGLIAAEKQVWRTQAGLPVLSASEPDRLARQLRAGGELDIRIEGSGAEERPRRYRLPIPASARSVDQVLTACDRPLSDDWDGLARVGAETVVWADQPAPEYPEAAMRAGVEAGAVVLDCIVPADGRLDVCRVRSETPSGAGFGEEALKGARKSQIRLAPDDTRSVGRLIQFTVRFLAG